MAEAGGNNKGGNNQAGNAAWFAQSPTRASIRGAMIWRRRICAAKLWRAIMLAVKITA